MGMQGCQLHGPPGLTHLPRALPCATSPSMGRQTCASAQVSPRIYPCMSVWTTWMLPLGGAAALGFCTPQSTFPEWFLLASSPLLPRGFCKQAWLPLSPRDFSQASLHVQQCAGRAHTSCFSGAAWQSHRAALSKTCLLPKTCLPSLPCQGSICSRARDPARFLPVAKAAPASPWEPTPSPLPGWVPPCRRTQPTLCHGHAPSSEQRGVELPHMEQQVGPS